MNTLKRFFLWPSNNLTTVIPIVLGLGFLTGYVYNTSFLKQYILLATFLMIFPTMIGFKLKEAFDLSHAKVLLATVLINFAIIPLIAYFLGLTFLTGEPQMFAGLAIASLLPTSGMTISWTMLHKGNVPAAVKITAVSLLIGSLLAPWYLLAMVGKLVQVDVKQTFLTISVIVFIPLILGNITHKFLMTRMTQEQFQKKVKPFFPALSVWAMLFVIFSSISMKARMIISNPTVIFTGLIVLSVFYLLNYLISTLTGRMLMDRKDAITVVYGTVMRNLSLALGLAVTTFGPKAGLIVTLAFILQVQSAAWYGKISEKLDFFREKLVKTS
ncbi:bile acid:sodium symporter [Thermincola ferriacetica]|uniref:Bile acid:sodium symporter n=1 Tax=Thermincola ferriacetica TaxID=281456 RepID=A0A0L6W767_9FIRM|nr:bile acid:sodium symporter [Thermincola ferriacetica]KNZ70924.1 bile acid:sodium symporter [Thermincola ferriacetica]